MKLKNYLFTLVIILIALNAKAQLSVQSSRELLKRLIPQHAGFFSIEAIPAAKDMDVFELESLGDKIILKGNNGVAIASALYYYLTEYAHCQVTWNGTNLKLPRVLPVIKTKIRKETPYQY